MLTENFLALGHPFNDTIATLAVITYCATLYPGICRELFSHRSIKILGRYRQQIGIISCLLACMHAVHSVQLSFSEHPYMDLLSRFHGHISGLVCLTIFVLLGVTSNRWMQKKLKKGWKHLHSLTYVLPLLLVWHIVSKMTDWTILTQLCFLLLISAASLLTLRFSKRILAF